MLPLYVTEPDMFVPLLLNVKVDDVRVEDCIASLKVAVMLLFRGTSVSLNAGYVDDTVGAVVSRYIVIDEVLVFPRESFAVTVTVFEPSERVI